MRPDPKPVVISVSFAGYGAVMASHFGGVNAALLLKPERRMPGVVAEEREVLVGQPANVLGQLIVALPKERQRTGLHGSGLKSPASI